MEINTSIIFIVAILIAAFIGLALYISGKAPKSGLALVILGIIVLVAFAVVKIIIYKNTPTIAVSSASDITTTTEAVRGWFAV